MTVARSGVHGLPCWLWLSRFDSALRTGYAMEVRICRADKRSNKTLTAPPYPHVGIPPAHVLPFSVSYKLVSPARQSPMEELYEHFASSIAADQPRLCCDIEVIEIHWSQQTLSIDTCGLTLQNVHKWLAAQSFDHDHPASTCIAKFALCDKDMERPWEGSPTALRIIEHFDLRLAYEYARSCVTGTTKVPRQQGTTTTYMAAHPKLVALWSVMATRASPPLSRVTLQAVLFASPCERARLKGLLSKPWDPSLTSHPMFPAFLCGLALSQEVDSTQEEINEAMRHVEARTGHHNSLKRHKEPAQGSWGHLSAKMSGFARKLASTSRKIQMATELQNFIVTNLDQEPGLGEMVHSRRLIGSHVQLMSARLEMQRQQNNFLVQKVNIQLTAVSLGSWTRDDDAR